jgi:hypothetical protein
LLEGNGEGVRGGAHVHGDALVEWPVLSLEAVGERVGRVE